MSESQSEKMVRDLFNEISFDIKKIPATNKGKSADYCATYETEKYIIEVKARSENTRYKEDFFGSGFATRLDRLGRTNTVSGITKNAAKQINASTKSPNEFGVIVLIAEDDDIDTQFTQFHYSLYGIVEVVVLDEHGVDINKQCYYMEHSDFYRLQKINAAILLSPIDKCLCCNEFADNFNKFKSSKLYKLFENSNGLILPKNEEHNGNAFIADTDIDRRNSKDILKYIKEKYELSSIRPNPSMKMKIGFIDGLA